MTMEISLSKGLVISDKIELENDLEFKIFYNDIGMVNIPIEHFYSIGVNKIPDWIFYFNYDFSDQIDTYRFRLLHANIFSNEDENVLGIFVYDSVKMKVLRLEEKMNKARSYYYIGKNLFNVHLFNKNKNLDIRLENVAFTLKVID